MLHRSLISSRKMKMEYMPLTATGPSKVKEVLLTGQVLPLKVKCNYILTFAFLNRKFFFRIIYRTL